MSAWIWMLHPAHLCVAEDCYFRLATYLNGVIVSTVGEYARPDDTGFQAIGSNRLYETMVFNARPRTGNECEACAYSVTDFTEIDAQGYNSAKDAYDGHLALCRKWAVV